MAKGDHIYVTGRAGGIPFEHHGIDMGDGTVVHLAPVDGARIAIHDSSDRFTVRRDSWEQFCGGRQPQIMRHSERLPAEQVVQQAEAYLGKTGYSLLDGNCEHLATLCATGTPRSRQIEMAEATVSALASLATKAWWVASSRVASRLCLRGVTKIHPAVLLADGAEVVALAIGCRRGLEASQTKRLARMSGNCVAAGVGVVLAGPPGALLCLATHSGSTVVADRICQGIRGALTACRTPA